MLTINKRQLDTLSTIFGAITGIFIVLTAQGFIDPRLGGAVAGISKVIEGVLTNKPATASPTTEELEESSSEYE